MTRDDVDVMTQEVVFRGHFEMRRYRLCHRLFRGGWGAPITREVFCRGPVVVVLPYDPASDRVLLIEQFRTGPLAAGDPNPWSVEAVAGVIDPGETPQDVARREALEEAGLALAGLEPVGVCYPSGGGMSEVMHLFIGLANLTAAGGHHGLETEGEDIRAWTEPFADALARVSGPGTHTGPLMTLLFWLALHRERLRAGHGAG